ncbi:hydrophobe/amphiphile efflux-1 (HAE1) family protein [Rhizobium tibeticum]|nr:hydrophobe/amphiphile efflux-1 (HAE1) family protein [Rhizobium tibeticum]
MLSAIFIARPRLAVVISLVITIAGLVALTVIPIAQFPDIVPPQVSVTVTYPGASAETVQQSVAQPIESRVVGVDNIIYMKSTSGNDGSYTLTVSFAVGTDPDINTVNVQNRVNLAEAQLPQEARAQGISVKKKSSALMQLIALTSTSGDHDQLFLSNYATINIIDGLKRIPGVGDVSLLTPSDYSMRIWVSPDRLTNFSMTPSDIVDALKRQNIQAAVGRIGAQPALPDQQFQLTIQTKGRLTTTEEFGNVVLRAEPDGSFVRIRDVGRVELTSKSAEQLGRQDGTPAAVLGIYQSPGGNAIATAEAINQLLEKLKPSFPEGVQYKVTYDTTKFVEEGIHEVVKTLIEAFVLVVIVVYLFLGSVRATLIPLIAVPVSLIGTFAVMMGLGFSANTVSLLALVLAIGIVVDDAIVVVEAVEAIWKRTRASRPQRRPACHARHHGADHRHYTGASFGLRAGGFHSRHFRRAVPAIRRCRLRVDGHLGHQRTQPLSGALRGSPEGPPRSEARSDPLRPERDRSRSRRLRRDRAALCSSGGFWPGLACGAYPRHRLAVQSDAHGLPPLRGPRCDLRRNRFA